jgi:hypothetical protein
MTAVLAKRLMAISKEGCLAFEHTQVFNLEAVKKVHHCPTHQQCSCR